jgi:apolipoprotein N-acyltransferase
MCLLARHPFSALGALGLLALAGLAVGGVPVDHPAGDALVSVLHTLGIGFYWAANALARHAPWLPGWLDVALVLVLGAAPYLAADVVWRRGLSRWRARAPGSRPPSPRPSTR